MWSVGLCVVTLLIICITHWTYKWRNPKCSGRLPPGSMGFPLIGETIQFFVPSHSLDVPPFIKKRIERYGPLFRTSLVGRPVIVSADPEFDQFIFQQEGKLVELWYLDSFAKLFGLDGSSNSSNANGYIHKYLRKLILNHIGLESLKEKFLPRVEEMARQTLHNWSNQVVVDVKKAASTMIFDFTTKQLFSYEPEKSTESMSETFINFLEGLMSFPLNIPGTTFHKCLKNQKKTLKTMKNMLQKRRASPEKHQGDFLDHVIEDMKNESFLTEDFIVYVMFGLLFASFDSIPSTTTLAIKLLTDHPLVMQELMHEHDAILKNREDVDSGITWKEYKSMTFTLQVINETLRLANVGPGLLRRTLKDIQVNGYTIPAGWTILVVPSALHLNPNTYEDPLAFNPWRWKGLESNVTSKNFIAFGGGVRSCAGVEFSKVLMTIFLHVFVTKYRWTKVKGGGIVRTPILGFGNGFQIKVSEKDK